MLTWVFSLLFATDDCAENQIANEKIREIHGPAGPPVQFPYFSKINSCMQNSLDHSIQMFIKRGASFIYFFFIYFLLSAMSCHVLSCPTISNHVLPCPTMSSGHGPAMGRADSFLRQEFNLSTQKIIRTIGDLFVAMASPSLGLLRAIVEKQSDGSIGQKADMTWYIWRWTKREGVTLQWWFD